jgi:hypothetical protein
MAVNRLTKTKKIAARLTEGHFQKLEGLAVVNSTTYTNVIATLLERVPVDATLVNEFGGIQSTDNANRDATDFDPQRAAVAS